MLCMLCMLFVVCSFEPYPKHSPAPSYNGFIRNCHAVPGLVRMNGRLPFQMWQGLPRQHYTMVYSMRCNQQQPRDCAGHGQATTEQT